MAPATNFPGGITAGTKTTISAPAAITATAMPAGGTGDAAGGWDTAPHRDAAIAAFGALLADVTALRTKLDALITALKATDIIG